MVADQPAQRRAQELAPVRDRRLHRRRGVGLEQPDQLWIGHRETPNEILIRNPALMYAAGQAPRAALPAGHVEGFADTFPRPFPRRSMPTSGTADRRSDPPIRPSRTAMTRCWWARPWRPAPGRSVDRRDRWHSLAACAVDRSAGGSCTIMRLGFLTAPLPDTPLWRTSPTGPRPTFDSLEIACWPPARAGAPLRGHQPHRRHRPHRRVASERDRRRIGSQPGDLRARLYPNPLHPDPRCSAAAIAHMKLVIEACARDGRAVLQHVHGRRPRSTSTRTGRRRSRSGPTIVQLARTTA